MKISVALCTYNGEKYLTEQLESILVQELSVDEIVICDDGSADNTHDILEDYMSRYPNLFKIIYNEKNLGYSKNFQKAIHFCSHDLIIISDQDDRWEKYKTAEIVRFMQANSNFDAVFHDLQLIDDGETKQTYLNWKSISHDSIIQDIENGTLFTALVTKGSFILGCSLAIRKSTVKDYNLKNFSTSHDYFIAQKLSSKKKLGFIPKSLSFYRLHPEQVYGLRYVSENEPVKESKSFIEQYFREHVYSQIQVIKRFTQLNPEEKVKKTTFYSKFLENRTTYLKMMKPLDRKIYIAKCLRHHYLDFNLIDLIKY